MYSAFEFGRSALIQGMRLSLPQRHIDFPRRPLLMGIVNVNDDSFSGDGTLDFGEALAQAKAQIEAGADIIDVGAESARTNREAIPVGEELRRFTGFLEGWQGVIESAKPRDNEQLWPPMLSANTWRPEVIEQLLPMGGIELLNDMSALPDGRNASACAKHGVALLIMHSVGEPKVAHTHQQWKNVMASIKTFFEEKIAMAKAAGLDDTRMVLDPGIEFAKQCDDNLTVYRELGQLQDFGLPVLVPVSRKTVIGEVLGIDEPKERDAGTVACIVASMERGAQMFRVHNVDAAWQAVKVLHLAY